VLLQNLTKANAAKVKRLRWSVQEEDWFPVTRDSRVDRRFWTLLQASFYETYQMRGHRIFPHRVLDWVSLRTAAGGADVREHFAHFRGLPRLLQIEQNRFIEDWVRVFYATAWIAPERRAVHFVFEGQVFGLSRATLAGIPGVDLVDVSLHEMVYGEADPPRRAMIGGIAPSHEAISQCFRQPFPASYARVPSLLTPEPYAVHMALRRTLLPRSGYLEGFTGLQQLLLLHILTHEPFDIVDFILAEIEDVITDGMGVVRQFPYAHWISYICSMIVPAESPVSAVYRQDEAPRFPVYRPTAPRTGGGADRPRELPWHSYRQRFRPEWPRRTRHYLRQRHSFPEETTRSTGQTLRPIPLRTTSTSLLHQLLTIMRQEDPESQLSQQSLLSPSLR